MLKLIYLAKRKPTFTPDAFTRRWRMHGAVGMSTVFWRYALGYVQAEPIRPAAIEGASTDYDAVAYLMVKDETFTAPQTPEDDASRETMLKDELETFAGPIPGVSLWVHEEKLKPGDLGGVTAFLFFADAAKARAVAERYKADVRLGRVVLNTRNDDTVMGPVGNTLPYAAVVEVSAGGLAALKAALGAADGPYRAADVTVVTREAVFWDRVS